MVIALAAAALLLSTAPLPVAIVTVLAIAAPVPALGGTSRVGGMVGCDRIENTVRRQQRSWLLGGSCR